MSHVPFMAIDAEAERAAFAPAPLIGADDLRSSHTTASISSPTTAFTNKVDDAITVQKSRVPGWISFPLTLIISLGLSAGLYSFVPEINGYELATVSRSLNEPWQIGGLLAWKMAEISIAWSAGLDYLDLFSLSVLANIPYYTLLHVFYETSVQALGLSFLIDTFSLTAPFYLLRPLNFYNASKTTSRPQTVSELAVDRSVQVYMTLFAAAVYSLIVYSSFYTWLPVYMIVHFDEVRSLNAAHDAVQFFLFLAFVPIGYAAKNFLFKPSIASVDAFPDPFIPESATLYETVRYNLGLGKHSTRESILTRRSVLLTWFTFLNTFVRVFGTVEGTDPYGAAGWAALWSVAASVVGFGFAWVGES